MSPVASLAALCGDGDRGIPIDADFEYMGECQMEESVCFDLVMPGYTPAKRFSLLPLDFGNASRTSHLQHEHTANIKITTIIIEADDPLIGGAIGCSTFSTFIYVFAPAPTTEAIPMALPIRSLARPLTRSILVSRRVEAISQPTIILDPDHLIQHIYRTIA